MQTTVQPAVLLVLLVLPAALLLAACSSDDSDATDGAETAAAAPADAGDATVRGIAITLADGTPASMDDYAGRPVLVVNTASRCGYTPQLREMEALHAEYRDRGLVVLAVPSASFNQEPLDSAGAADFCEEMGATYVVAAKSDVVGEAAHPLFARLAEAEGEPRWNFTKYLIDQEGRVVARFDSAVEPTSDVVTFEIDRLLAGG
ncbi:MAG: glutathione peroxidase [Planctomycetota bacterium]